MKYTDKELLDFLDNLNARRAYTGKCILRKSTSERGWRLHETSQKDAKSSVREAIQNFIDIEG